MACALTEEPIVLDLCQKRGLRVLPGPIRPSEIVSGKFSKSRGGGWSCMRVIGQSPDPLARMHTMTKRQGKSGTIDIKAVLAEDEEFLRALVRMGLQVGLLRPNADHAGRQAGAAGAAGSQRAVLDRAVRTVSALGAGAGGSAGGDVRARGFDSQGQGDHRGAVRS